MQAKVSIIVPVYNSEVFLYKCLNSLVSQSLSNIEVIVVNDGSKDNSQEIIDDFSKKYPQIIKSFIKENGGLSDARNFGIEKARGEYLGFVDSDDFVNTDMFHEMYTLAKKHNADTVISNIQKVDEKGLVIQKLTQIPNMPEKIYLKNNFSVFSDISYFACNKIFRKELFENHKFKKNVHFEDIELIPKIILQCDIIAQTQNYHYQYLERSGSISKTYTDKGLHILDAVISVEKYFVQSKYKKNTNGLKGFQILEGVYTYLAYLAYVKDKTIFYTMTQHLSNFMKERNISVKDILSYKRFGKNYILSLSLKKQIFYLLYFFAPKPILRILI